MTIARPIVRNINRSITRFIVRTNGAPVSVAYQRFITLSGDRFITSLGLNFTVREAA